MRAGAAGLAAPSPGNENGRMTTRLHPPHLVLMFALQAFVAAHAHAAYVCKDAKGGTIIQQTPCKDETPPPTPSG